VPEKRHWLVDRIDDRSHVLELSFQLVLGGVAALADATAIHRVDRVALREGRTDIG